MKHSTLSDPGSRRFVRALLAAMTWERWPGETVEDPAPELQPVEEGQRRRHRALVTPRRRPR